MTTVVVMGNHGGGTSLVAGLLITLGVDMGSNHMGPMKGYPTNEDKDFVLLNAAMLSCGGGNWGSPPAKDKLEGCYEKFSDRVAKLVKRKNGSLGWNRKKGRIWGWKDPRNCLTLEFYYKHLIDPRYVWVRRNHDDVARSILSRGPSAKDHKQWVHVAETYDERVRSFIQRHDAMHQIVHYESLLDRARTADDLKILTRFIGLSNANIPSAVAMVKSGGR